IYTDFNVSVVKSESEKIVIEAEEPVETYECKNVSDMSAEGSEASGGKGLGSDKAYLDSYMKYEFYAPEAGTYDLSVWYVTMNTRWISLQINDQMKTFMACDILTGNWNGVPSETAPGVASKSVKVYCEEGKNTLTVGAVYGYSPEEGRDQPYTPNIDRYELVRSDVEIEKPRDWTAADRIEREIESYDSKSGNASISKRVAFGTQQGGILAANGVFAYEVEAPEEGVYCMNIGYATANRRWIKVMVNELDTHYVGFFDYNGWGENANEKVYHHHLLVYLNKGKNLIELGQYKKEGAYASESDNSPALDRFTLDLVSYPEYEAPERKVNFYGHTLAEAAKWSSTFADILFFDHNEYTSSVSESTSATVTAEFPWPVVITGYAFATRNNTDGWKVMISSNGESWKELTAVSTEKSGIIRTVRTENPYSDAAGNAARFVRLEISGSEPASLGEFCLWGNPYVSAECHMPAGVLEPGFADFETTHEGFDTGGWHEGIDKMFNGICTDRFTVAADGTGSMGDYDDITIDLNLGKAVAVNSYLMAVHYTTSYDRNPTQWELYRGAAVTEASQYDEGYDEWNLIDSRSDMNFVMPGSALPMYVDNETESDRYRLVIKNRRGKATHLAGFQMFTAPDYTGIEGVEANAGILMVSGGDGVIRILASAGEAYAVYTSSGLTVATGEGSADAVEIAVPRGIYVVAAGAKAVKVLVK
ncbi:MAG: hypothetical protein K2H14_04270, partial [Muribaculaceae bacterium]|nr:hypothetical protein [Muribaculaceae bacterium]